MPRLRLYDVRLSRLPELVGKCQGDVAGICQYVNAAQRRLLMCREAGDEGWYGTWSEVAFNLVSRNNPYITCPREVARLERIDLCGRPCWIQNQFYEYLDFGNGRMPKRHHDSDCLRMAYTRNNVFTFTDQSISPCTLRIYTSDPADQADGNRVFLQGLDQNGSQIYTTDGLTEVMGEFVVVGTPFADSTYQYSQITGIQKDVTVGFIQIFQVDPVTGNQTLLLTMEPSETVAGYRRYYLNGLPPSCCNAPTTTVPLQVTAIAKLELVPVAVDTDYLLIGNLEAITEEVQSVRYSEIDSESAKKMAQEKHLQAIRLLQGELVHYLGKNNASVSFSPFGTARLERQKIGTLI